MLSGVSTVADNALKYSNRTYKRALRARKLQNIIMRPATRKYKDVIIDYLGDSPVTKSDIQAAEDTILHTLRLTLYVEQSGLLK